jgi:penicillin-binding protein 1B
MANRAGMNYKIQPTPAVALGAYEISPLEAAGAYTMFSNFGNYVKPGFLRMVRDGKDGKTLFKSKLEEKHVLDPRVAYLVTNLMEEVLRSGTAAGIRGKYGFTVPAAGKTGTSHDGWFAGFTSELLCVVWVGFDDNQELNLEGAHSAAPIWGEFMKTALQYREYRGTNAFQAPDGIVSIDIDPESGMPATPGCPTKRKEVYIAGTEPVGACPLHGGGSQGITTVTGWETSPADKKAANPSGDTAPRIQGSGGDGQVTPGAVARRAARQEPPEPPTVTPGQGDQSEEAQRPQKKGFWNRLKGVFKK